MRILQISVPQELKEIMQEIQVDKYGIKIMLPKALHYLVRINTMPCITANILKQEMLSLGADAAVARGALTGKIKNTDCLLMGSLSQFRRLGEKLNHQPFGLDRVGKELLFNLNNYQKETFSIDLGRYKLSLGRRTLIMGVVNLTPDSFSADGLYQGKGQKPKTKNIIDFVDRLMQEGADIIDIGGESSRPGARAVPLKEELRRTIPVIKIIAKKIKVPISIDTCKPQVARQALDNGALIINDITGLRNSSMARLAARYKAGVVIMHMRGRPRTMQNNLVYDSLLDEVIGYLEQSINQAVSFGVDREKIIIDPGIGFGKAWSDNLEILNRLREFKILGRPILVGVSRKYFIGKILHSGPGERLFGTVSASVLAVKNGAQIIRVHDVKEVKQAIKVADAINRS